MRIENFQTVRRAKALLPYALIVGVYAVCRLLSLDHMAHGDERHWVGRSLNFYRALSAAEFEYTYQMQHPGVMTMWAGTLGYFVGFPEILAHISGNNSVAERNTIEMWNWGVSPPDVLVTLRAAKVLLQALFFALALRFLAPVTGNAITILFGSVLAVSPTLVGWDSWLHIDGLAAITGIAGIAAVAYAAEQTELGTYLSRGAAWYWFIAGAICATSWLNRITGLVLVTVIAAALVVQVVSQHRSTLDSASRRMATLRSVAYYASIAAAGALVATLLLFPALWVKPFSTLKEIIVLPISGARGEGPENFFPGTLVDPGWSYYPSQILLRTTPFEWLGVALAVILAGYAARRNLVPHGAIRLLPVLFVFTLAYVGAVSLSPKKAGQYIAYVYPVIALFASIGFVTLGSLLVAKWDRFGRPVAWGLCASAVVYSSVATAQALPYKNIYNNPLVLQISGEPRSYTIRPGYPQLAEFFIDLDPVPPTKVGFSSGGFGAIFPYLIPPTMELEATSWRKITSPAQWYGLEYHIVGTDYPVGDANPVSLVAPLFKLETEGRVLWEVYPKGGAPTYHGVLSQSECTRTFGEHVTLYQIFASGERTDLYFQSENGRSVIVEVIWEFGDTRMLIGKEELDPLGSSTLERVSLDPVVQGGPEPLGNGPLTIFVYDLESGEVLAVTSTNDEEVHDHAIVESQCFRSSKSGE